MLENGQVRLDEELQVCTLHRQVVLHAGWREALRLAVPATLSIFRASHELMLQLAHLLDARSLIHMVQVQFLQLMAWSHVSQELLHFLHCFVVVLARPLCLSLVLPFS